MNLKPGMLVTIKFGKKDHPVVLLLKKATKQQLKTKSYDWYIEWWEVLEIDEIYLIPQYMIKEVISLS